MVDLSDFDYRELEDERSANRQGGSAGPSLYTGTYRGETVYVRHTKDAIDSDADGLCEPYRKANIAADIVLQDLEVTPSLVYDEDSGRIVVEDAGETVDAVREVSGMDTDSYVKSVLAKRLVGDTDAHPGNITMDDDGLCHPIDPDYTGRYTMLKDTLDDPYSHVIHGAHSNLPHELQAELDLDDMERYAEEMAAEMDFDRVWEGLQTSPHIRAWENRDKLFTAVEWFEDEYASDGLFDSVRSMLGGRPQPRKAIM